MIDKKEPGSEENFYFFKKKRRREREPNKKNVLIAFLFCRKVEEIVHQKTVKKSG